MNTVTITINNMPVVVRANASILQACEEASIDIPRFCYHEKLSVAGNCRMCLVEVQKSPKPVVSCAMPVSKGMVIFTDTPLVRKAREAVLEFLLINHPLDCPICDQGGECDLQDETLQYGSDRGRFFEFKRSVEDKECGPIVKTIMTRCIHCTRCVRFAAEVAGNEVLGAFGRGQDTEIGGYIQTFIKTELSGNLVDLCPVGALTSKPYAYLARSWELQKIDSIDFLDGICSEISVHTRAGTTTNIQNFKNRITSQDEILRVLPRSNGVYKDNWISDKTRYAHDGLSNQRLVNIYKYDRLGLNWKTLVEDLSHLLQVSNVKKTGFPIAAVVGSTQNVESLYVISQFVKLLGFSDIQFGNYTTKANYDNPSYFLLNRSLESFEKLTALFMIGTNPRYEASLLNTILRKQQNYRGIPLISVGSYSSLKIKQNHGGNSLASLASFVEGRKASLNSCYLISGSSVIVGFDNFKLEAGGMIQNMARFVGKKFFAKTKQGERLGVLHSNVTTLNMAMLGINVGVKSPLNSTLIEDNKYGVIMAVSPESFNTNQWLSTSRYTTLIGLSTHKDTSLKADFLAPVKSVYEKEGLVYNVEGRLRKFYKVVTGLKTARTVESFLLALANKTVPNKNFLAHIWNLKNEINISKTLEKEPVSFAINPYNYREELESTEDMPFAPHITNFYMTDVISKNSVTMGECSLFLNKNTNFSLNN